MNCAQTLRSGWWHAGCSNANLNGMYLNRVWDGIDVPENFGKGQCIFWRAEEGATAAKISNKGNLKKVDMKIKRML